MPSPHPVLTRARRALLAVAALAAVSPSMPAGAPAQASVPVERSVTAPAVEAAPTASTAATTVTRHVRTGTGLFVDVYSTTNTSGTYAQHYLPRGGMVKGTVHGAWFRMASNRWVPLSRLTTSHSSYTGTNGRHWPSSLCPVRGTSVARHVLTSCRAVPSLEALNTAYRARFGSDLPWDECYRTYDTQVAYRRAWGTKAAVPGYSNHGSLTRSACDVPEQPTRFGFGTTRYAWLVTHGPRYGWVHPT